MVNEDLSIPDVVDVVSGSVSVLSGASVIVRPADLSGQEIIWRGVRVSGAVIVSGTVTSKVSGETISIEVPTTVVIGSGATTFANPRVLGQSSGYVSTSYALHGLTSGVIKSLTVRAHPSNSGDVYLGGNVAPNLPTSGVGMLIRPGEAFDMEVNQIASVWCVAEVSGDSVFFAGVN